MGKQKHQTITMHSCKIAGFVFLVHFFLIMSFLKKANKSRKTVYIHEYTTYEIMT